MDIDVLFLANFRSRDDERESCGSSLRHQAYFTAFVMPKLIIQAIAGVRP